MTRQNLSSDPEAHEAFHGAKLALFIGENLTVIRRDDLPDLPYAGCIDLPGGMREPGETPQDCALRELKEELGLTIPAESLVQPRFYPAPTRAWFFAAYLPDGREKDIVFGNEGQGWWLMPPWSFVTAEDAVPHFRDRVRLILETAPG